MQKGIRNTEGDSLLQDGDVLSDHVAMPRTNSAGFCMSSLNAEAGPAAAAGEPSTTSSIQNGTALRRTSRDAIILSCAFAVVFSMVDVCVSLYGDLKQDTRFWLLGHAMCIDLAYMCVSCADFFSTHFASRAVDTAQLIIAAANLLAAILSCLVLLDAMSASDGNTAANISVGLLIALLGASLWYRGVTTSDSSQHRCACCGVSISVLLGGGARGTLHTRVHVATCCFVLCGGLALTVESIWGQAATPALTLTFVLFSSGLCANTFNGLLRDARGATSTPFAKALALLALLGLLSCATAATGEMLRLAGASPLEESVTVVFNSVGNLLRIIALSLMWACSPSLLLHSTPVYVPVPRTAKGYTQLESEAQGGWRETTPRESLDSEETDEL